MWSAGGRGVIDMHNFLGKPLSSLLLPSTIPHIQRSHQPKLLRNQWSDFDD